MGTLVYLCIPMTNTPAVEGGGLAGGAGGVMTVLIQYVVRKNQSEVQFKSI